MSSERALLTAAALLLFAICAAPSCPAIDLNRHGDEEVIFAELAGTFRKHCVQVYINAKSYDGVFPPHANIANDVRNERATTAGGYWWDDRHVIIEDPVLQDQFIRSVEIGLPYSDRRYQARIAGRFVNLQAILLEVLPGEDGIMPQAFPLAFVDGDVEEAVVMAYGWSYGTWGVGAGTAFGSVFLDDAGIETAELKKRGVLLDKKGNALGLAFGNRLFLDEDIMHWRGSELAHSPLFDREETAAARKTLEAKLRDAVLEVRFAIRVKVDEDEEDTMPRWLMSIDSGGESAGSAELRAAALVVGPNHLLAPVSMDAPIISHIEEITVHAADGRRLEARFIGALRDYKAVLIQTREALPTGNLPAGFSLLDPLLVSEEAFLPDREGSSRPVLQYLQRWRVDYELGRRRQVVDYDRWIGTFPGYRGDPIVHTFTNEKDGALAFDIDNNLVAVALTPRVLNTPGGVDVPYRDNRQAPLVGASFRPLDFLSRKLHAPDVFDPAMRPVNEKDGKRIIDFGVEFQGLDDNTARLFRASRETRGGKIGLLVTHVYPGFPAEALGIRENDVLLRFYVEGKKEPMELRTRENHYQGLWDLTDEQSTRLFSMYGFLPPPWPSRHDVLSTILTSAGIERAVAVEFLREGEPMRGEFVTQYTAPDFRNAGKEKFTALGLTIKPITYEVQRYFGRSNAAGVIISDVEKGGKASVAGLYRYLLITRINGVAINNVDEFREQVARFEGGKSPSVELTIEEFGKTRLVKIE